MSMSQPGGQKGQRKESQVEETASTEAMRCESIWNVGMATGWRAETSEVWD